MFTLIVEDQITSRILLQTLLSAHGTCHTAVTGEEAVEAFGLARQRGAPYDLVCMDIKKPGMDGVEAVRQMREMEETAGLPWNQGAKILMAYPDDSLESVMGSRRPLCDSYFTKPIDTVKLTNELRVLRLI